MKRDRAPVVTPLSAGDYAAAGAVLSRAFHSDPLWTTVIPDPNRRPGALAALFTALTRTTMAARGVLDTTANLQGVALWQPPGTEIGLWAMARAGFAMPRFVMSLPKSERRPMMQVLRDVGDRKKALRLEPHWYVAAIGVDPESQGTGVGSALMKHGITRADRGEAPVYLETETESNLKFYEHLGFEVVGELTPTGTSFRMWLMLRPANSKDA